MHTRHDESRTKSVGISSSSNCNSMGGYSTWERTRIRFKVYSFFSTSPPHNANNKGGQKSYTKRLTINTTLPYFFTTQGTFVKSNQIALKSVWKKRRERYSCDMCPSSPLVDFNFFFLLLFFCKWRLPGQKKVLHRRHIGSQVTSKSANINIPYKFIETAYLYSLGRHTFRSVRGDHQL